MARRQKPGLEYDRTNSECTWGHADTKSAFHIVVRVLDEAPNFPVDRDFRDLEQQLGQDYDVQFLLVDDGSTDGTRKPVRRLTGFTGRFYAMSGTSLRAS